MLDDADPALLLTTSEPRRHPARRHGDRTVAAPGRRRHPCARAGTPPRLPTRSRAPAAARRTRPTSSTPPAPPAAPRASWSPTRVVATFWPGRPVGFGADAAAAVLAHASSTLRRLGLGAAGAAHRRRPAGDRRADPRPADRRPLAGRGAVTTSAACPRPAARCSTGARAPGRRSRLRCAMRRGGEALPAASGRRWSPAARGTGSSTSTARPRPPSYATAGHADGAAEHRRPCRSAARSPTPGPTSWTRACGRCRRVCRASCTWRAPGWPAAIWARPALTAERFVADPFGRPGRGCTAPATWSAGRADGQLEFCGRADDQVKVRGFRIELGEIEAALSAPPAASHRPWSIVREDRPGDRASGRLRRPGRTGPDTGPAAVPAAELRAHLADRLPDYMVPAASSRSTRCR